MKTVCVSGIGTGVGKTVASAVICERFGASYWKPIQSGLDDEPGDSRLISELITNGQKRIFSESYNLRASLSPHIAASLEKIEIDVDSISLPNTADKLVVELAGGLLVPLSDNHTNVELVKRLGLPLVIVSRHYLGSINHTLLTIETARNRGLHVLGVIFVGEELADSERIIKKMGDVQILGKIRQLPVINSAQIRGAAEEMSAWW